MCFFKLIEVHLLVSELYVFNFVLNYKCPLPSTTTLGGQIWKHFLSYIWVNKVTEVPTFPVTSVRWYFKTAVLPV